MDLYAVISGEIIPIEAVKDEVFSTKMMGDGIGIKPIDNILVSPEDAIIVSANENMKHALGIQLKNGVEILLHVGIDTVNLENKGFELLVSNGQSVRKGDPLMKIDRNYIKNEGIDDTIMFIVTNSNGKTITFESKGTVNSAENIIGTIK